MFLGVQPANQVETSQGGQQAGVAGFCRAISVLKRVVPLVLTQVDYLGIGQGLGHLPHAK